jgi:hypothetical protein
VTQDAWLSKEQGHFARIEIHRHDEHGQVMKQSFLKDDILLFQLEQTQTTPAGFNTPIRVAEKRYYYVDGRLSRVLAKEGSFPAKAKIDTVGIKNVPVPLDQVEGSRHAFCRRDQRLLESC